MKRLGENNANVAMAHSLLTVVYAILKGGHPYQEPGPKQMHESERGKRIRYHSKRLRELGADDELIREMVAKLTTQPAACSPAGQRCYSQNRVGDRTLPPG